MNIEPPTHDDGVGKPSRADAHQSHDNTGDAEHTPDIQPRTALNPLTAADVDAAFVEITTMLRQNDSGAFHAPGKKKPTQVNPTEAPADLIVDLGLGMVTDPTLALCQMCLTGLVDVRTRRVCAHCVTVDRLLAKRFDAARFLPTTRTAGTFNRCQMLRKLMPRTTIAAGNRRMHRTVERETWQHMQQLFESHLQLLAQLRGLSTTQPISYADWVDGHTPSITRSLDAYLAYTIVHAPWARTHVEQLIVDNEGRLA